MYLIITLQLCTEFQNVLLPKKILSNLLTQCSNSIIYNLTKNKLSVYFF